MPINFQSETVIEYGQLIGGLAIILLLGLLIFISVRRAIDTAYRRRYISQSVYGILQFVARWTISIVILLVSLQQIGISVESVWAAMSAVIVLLGVGFVAVWSVISNVLCSLLLLISRPFNIGDEIEVIEATGGSGLRGKVVNINLLFTFLEETNEKGEDTTAFVHVPNNMFFQKTIRRWRGTRTWRLEELMFKEYQHDKPNVDNSSVNQVPPPEREMVKEGVRDDNGGQPRH